MSLEEKKAAVQSFVESFNQGDLSAFDEHMSRDFFNYAPAAGEETAPEVFRELAGDLLVALPDLQISVGEFAEQEDTITFSLTAEGTHQNTLWGAPPTGMRATWDSTVTGRFAGGKFAVSWEDISVPAMLGTLQQVGLVPPREDMDKPHPHPVSIPEIILKLVFTGQVADKDCSHLDQIQVVEPDIDVCEQCVALGDEWPALRMCLICGYVGCCDTAKNKHMKQHYEETGHAIFRSIRLQESWVWCYADNAFFSGKILQRAN